MAINSCFRRCEFAGEFRNANGLSRTRDPFQQAQRQVDGFGGRTFVNQLRPSCWLVQA